MRKSQFDYEPSLVLNEGKTALISFDAEAKEVSTSMDDDDTDAEKRTVYEAYAVRVAQPLTRDNIISAIIGEAYPQDKMQAIINNHLVNLASTDVNEEHEQEYEAMQAWRTKAKEVADKVIDSL